MSNAQILEDLRYCADHFIFDKATAEANVRQFAASLIGPQISSPAQKPAPVSGDSGGGLVGNPHGLEIGQRVRVRGRAGFVHGFIIEIFGDSVQVSNDFGVTVTVRSALVIA